MTKHSILAAGLLVMVSTVALADRTTSMADLRALIDQKAYEEAISRLGDIAPTDRNADWQDLAAKAAVGLINGEKDGANKLAFVLRIDSMYPTLGQNAGYATLRAEVATKNYPACFDAHHSRYGRHDYGKDCVEMGAKLIDGDASNAKLTLTLAKAAYHQLKDEESFKTVVLFKRAVDAAKGGAACKDADTWAATQRAMGGPADSDHAKAAHDIATACWSELRKSYLDWIVGTKGAWRTNGCVVMKEKKEHDLSMCTGK